MARAQVERRGRPALAGVVAGLVAASALGCGNQVLGAGARLAGPTDFVLFDGITAKMPGLHRYLAVTSSRTDSIALIDPADDQPVLSPMVAYPLAITTAPRPLRVAAAALGDGGADVLVTATRGSLELAVIETWTATNRVAQSAAVSLAPLLGDAQILSLAGMTPASASPASPRARILVGVSGGRLAVVDFVRDAATGGVVPQQPVVKEIGFDPLDISMEPAGVRAFFATTDPLASGTGTVHGVAYLDVSGDAALAWAAPTVLDAGAPTTAVAVGSVRERLVDPTNPNAPSTFGDPAPRVYAIVDPTACGVDRAIACGVVMMDDHGLLPDPVDATVPRAPLPVPGIPAGITIAYPPASGAGRVTTDTYNPDVPLLALYPGPRNTAAIGAVTSSDGNVYLYDLSRFAPAMASSALAMGSGVVGAVSILPADVGDPSSANYGKDLALGLWTDFPVGAAAQVTVDPSVMPGHVQVTPGITPTDFWILTWQGVLPSLAARPGAVGRTAAGDTYVALQANAGTAAQPVWVSSVAVADPALAIHGGDIVSFAPDDPAACPATDAAHPYPELVISATTPFLAADPAFPGGALLVGGGGCFDALPPGAFRTGIVTVRAGGLVLTSNQLGYLGRPTFDQAFTVAHQDEKTLTGEALVLSRKARRSFYPVESPCAPGGGQAAVPGCYAGFPLVADPLAPGPAIAFRVGVKPTLDTTDPAVLQRVPRDARIIVQSSTGIVPGTMLPINGGVLPTRLLSYDATGVAGHENDPVGIFALYGDDQLLEFMPSIAGGGRRTLR